MEELQELLKTNNFIKIKEVIKREPLHLVCKTEEKDKLYLLCPNREKSNYEDPTVRQANGAIMTKKDNKIVCLPFEHIKEYPERYDHKDWENNRVEECVDGTLIKVFPIEESDGKLSWKVATNRCVDARNSYWISDKSFYDLFQEASESLDYSKLNKRHCYCFVLIHKENQNVKDHKENKIIHVFTRDLDTLKEVSDNIGVETPKTIEFKSFDNVVQSVEELPYDTEGYMVINAEGKRTKIQNSKFLASKKLKGNIPNMTYRCIVVDHIGQRDEFLKYYPKYQDCFDYINMKTDEISDRIFYLYLGYYVNKKPIKASEDERMILNHLHKEYLQGGRKNKTTKESVISRIKRYSPTRKYLMFFCEKKE
jgi:hypothetical protein